MNRIQELSREYLRGDIDAKRFLSSVVAKLSMLELEEAVKLANQLVKP